MRPDTFNIITGEIKPPVKPNTNPRFAAFGNITHRETALYSQQLPKLRKLGVSSDAKGLKYGHVANGSQVDAVQYRVPKMNTISHESNIEAISSLMNASKTPYNLINNSVSSQPQTV